MPVVIFKHVPGSQCAGGGHFTLELTGDVTGQIRSSAGEVQEGAASVGREELLGVMIRLAKLGHTNNQIVNALRGNGVRITVELL